jgi:hypothetical protein
MTQRLPESYYPAHRIGENQVGNAHRPDLPGPTIDADPALRCTIRAPKNTALARLAALRVQYVELPAQKSVAPVVKHSKLPPAEKSGVALGGVTSALSVRKGQRRLVCAAVRYPDNQRQVGSAYPFGKSSHPGTLREVRGDQKCGYTHEHHSANAQCNWTTPDANDEPGEKRRPEEQG